MFEATIIRLVIEGRVQLGVIDNCPYGIGNNCSDSCGSACSAAGGSGEGNGLVCPGSVGT